MEILVLKDGEVFAHFGGDDATYTLVTIPQAEVPAVPKDTAGVGKQWELDYTDGVLQWVAQERPLTTEERLEQLQQDVEAIKHEWKAGEAVVIGDRRYYNGVWYTCLQAHTTQADWTPDVTAALWKGDV